MKGIENMYFPNNGAKYVAKLSNLLYLTGFPNFWVENLNYSKMFLKYYGYFSNAVNGFLYLFIMSEWASSFTQHNLTEKQSSDSLIFKYSHPILFSYRIITTYHQDKIRELVYRLFVSLKQVYNDEKVEQLMIKKCKALTIAFATMCSISMLLYGCNALLLCFKTGATFTTVVIFWPDVDDKSIYANIGRGFAYLTWWIFMTRVFAAYGIVLALIIALEHQYKNLKEYFQNLGDIFNEDLSQVQKETKYEEGVKVGIKMHSDTLKCVQLAQDTCSTIYCLHILLNISVVVSLMAQMVNSERSVGVVFTIVSSAISMLISTAFFMWTAGDVTVEAATLSTDMYWSGWQNCCVRAASVRKLLAVAMAQAQKPVVIKGLGVVQISYRAYLTIVRSSYSIFTVLF